MVEVHENVLQQVWMNIESIHLFIKFSIMQINN